MTRRRLGLAGLPGAGKSTVAKILVERHGFTRLRFAGRLKAMLHALGLDERHTDGDLKETPCDLLGGKTPREAMQTLGTDWGRQLVAPDLWLRAAIAEARRTPGDIVFDDVRFENEAAIIRKAGGHVLRVERPSAGPGNDHLSNAPLPEGLVSARIVNDGDLGQLARQINFALQTLTLLAPGRNAPDT